MSAERLTEVLHFRLGDVVPGDRLFRWVWVGGERHDVQPLTVVRVNRRTVTVRTDHGGVMRLPPGLIAGRYTEDGAA